MSKIRVSAPISRGDYGQIIVHDTTRVTHPVTANIFIGKGIYLVVPENSQFPVVHRDNLSSALSFVEQMIPDEA